MFDKSKFALYWLTLVYVSGTIGMLLAPDFFLPFTPLNLLMSAGLLLVTSSAEKFSLKALLASLACIAPAAWAIEWLGVHTGLIFGSYTYGHALGISFDGIPLIIGINWWMLAYCSVNISVLLFRNHSRLAHAAVAATLMTSLDVLMEFVAPKLHFWQFEGMTYAPLHNFIGWWCSAFVLILAFGKPLQTHRSALSVPLFVLQMIFFGVLGIIL